MTILDDRICKSHKSDAKKDIPFIETNITYRITDQMKAPLRPYMPLISSGLDPNTVCPEVVIIVGALLARWTQTCGNAGVNKPNLEGEVNVSTKV